MADSMKMGKMEIKEKLEPVSEAVAKASQTVSDMAKEAAEKAAPKVKAAAKKAEPSVKAAGKTIKETGKRAAAATRRAASALAPEVYVQWDGGEVACADVAERVRADFKANNKGAIRSCQIYIKPGDGVAYYVINEKNGKILL